MARGSSHEINPFGSALGEYHVKLRIGEYKRPKPFSRTQWTHNKVVILPLPQEMRDDTPVSYNNVDLETVGDVVNGAYSGAAGAIGLRKIGDGLASGASVLGTAIGGMTGLGGNRFSGAVADSAADLLPADQITSAIQQGMGMAPNPNPSVMFQGPQLREFALTWTLFPTSSSEAQRIRRLVKILKQAALPRNVIGGAASVLRYPNMVQMNFYPWDNDYASNEWGWGANSIIKLKKCMMSAVNVSYTPSNVPAFHHGDKAPVATQITISFKEIEYMMSHDWDGQQADKDAGLGEVLGAFGNFAGEQGSQLTSAFGESFGSFFEFGSEDNPTNAET